MWQDSRKPKPLKYRGTEVAEVISFQNLILTLPLRALLSSVFQGFGFVETQSGEMQVAVIK
jgi:hypothetical protein